MFSVDSSDIGTTWQINDRSMSPYIVAYRDFRSQNILLPQGGYHGIYPAVGPYVISQGYAGSITITEDMKYISFWSGSNSFIASEVYRSDG